MVGFVPPVPPSSPLFRDEGVLKVTGCMKKRRHESLDVRIGGRVGILGEMNRLEKGISKVKKKRKYGKERTSAA